MRHIARTTVILTGATGLLGFSALALQAQPTRPPPTREQVAQMAAKRQAFCEGVLKLGVLARTNFRSIDKGLKPGNDLFHASAMTLPDASDCNISIIEGQTSHTCSFPSKPEALFAQTRAISGLLARCLGVPPPQVTTDEMGAGAAIIRDGIRYAVQSNDNGWGELVDVSLHVAMAK